MKSNKIVLLFLLFSVNVFAQTNAVVTDSIAEKMLLYQRNIGGWPQPGGDPINYRKSIPESLKEKLISEKDKKDCTIDDEATTREINGLVAAYSTTKNAAYLEAAERGIAYLLKAQNPQGGWGQFYPDSSGYHKYITFNDNAMIDVMWVMKNIVDGKKGFEFVNKNLIPQAQEAVNKGVACILKCQVKQNGKLTVWCAQHDNRTLAPAKARAFELASLSGHESTGIVKFLMTIKKPSAEVKAAILGAVAWFEAVKIVGINTKVIDAPELPKKKDRVVYDDPTSTMWARFYDLDTNEPFFVGRDSVRKKTLAEIENERRMGYAYYGKWPANLLTNDYPKWKEKWGK